MARENKDYLLTPWGLVKFETDLINNMRTQSHFFHNINFTTGMFIYDNLPDSIPERFLEMYLQENGSVGFTKDSNGELVIIRGGHTGDVVRYGLGADYLGSNDSPEGEIRFTVGVDGVVGYNNATMSPNFDALFNAHILTEIEKSLLFNIRYSRLAPVFEATDSDNKKQIEELLNNIDDGKMVNVISEQILQKIETGGNEVLKLTDVKEVDKIQYLIKAYEDVKRMYSSKFGLGDRGSGKLAQQTVDEVNGSIGAEFSLPLEMLYYRRLMVEDVNNMFADILPYGNIVVRFSPAWEIEYQKFITTADADSDKELAEDIADETAEESTEESTEETAEDGAEESEESKEGEEEND